MFVTDCMFGGQSKYGCKDQESIQSSTTPDPGYPITVGNSSYFDFLFNCMLVGRTSDYMMVPT